MTLASTALEMDTQELAERLVPRPCVRKTHAEVLGELGTLAYQARQRLLNSKTYAYDAMDRGTVQSFAYLVRCLADELESL